MTNKLITTGSSLLLAMFLIFSATLVQASEVTGVLSSGVTATTSVNGQVSGEVVDEDDNGGGGSSSGSRSNRSGGNSNTSGDGEVLGAATSLAPSFPNAGFMPEGNGMRVALVAGGALLTALLAFAAMKYRQPKV